METIADDLLACIADFFDQESYSAASQVCRWWSKQAKSSWPIRLILHDSASTETLFRHRNKIVSLSSERSDCDDDRSFFAEKDFYYHHTLEEEVESNGGFFFPFPKLTCAILDYADMNFFRHRPLPALRHLTLMWGVDVRRWKNREKIGKFLEQVSSNLLSLKVDNAFAYYASDATDLQFPLVEEISVGVISIGKVEDSPFPDPNSKAAWKWMRSKQFPRLKNIYLVPSSLAEKGIPHYFPQEEICAPGEKECMLTVR